MALRKFDQTVFSAKSRSKQESVKDAPSTHSRKNRLLLAIISNFTKSRGIKYFRMIALLVYAYMLLQFFSINRTNANSFDFFFDAIASKLCTIPNYGNGALSRTRFSLPANEAWGARVTFTLSSCLCLGTASLESESTSKRPTTRSFQIKLLKFSELHNNAIVYHLKTHYGDALSTIININHLLEVHAMPLL